MPEELGVKHGKTCNIVSLETSDFGCQEREVLHVLPLVMFNCACVFASAKERVQVLPRTSNQSFLSIAQ